METRRYFESSGVERSVKSSRYCTATWFVLICSGLLIAGTVSQIWILNQPVYIYEQSGVLYYAGFTEPASSDFDLIASWTKLPVVQLFYDGPDQLRKMVEEILCEIGIQIGSGDFLLIKLRVQDELCHVEVKYRDFSYEENAGASQIREVLSSSLRGIFPILEKPSDGYLVEIRDDVEIKRTHNAIKPVSFLIPEKLYEVAIKGETRLLPEGFYNFFGQIVYLNKNMKIEDSAFFIEGAQMVYKLKNEFLVYRDGKLLYPDGQFLVIDEPYDVLEEKILPKLVAVKAEGGMQINSAILGKYREFLVLASGMIVPLDFSWVMKISNPLIEWCAKGDELYVLDLSSFVKAVDLKRKKILWEKHIPGAWGISCFEDYIYVGVGQKVLKLDRNGNVLSEENCNDFGSWREGIIILKSEEEGFIVRNKKGFVVMKNGQATLYMDEPRVFDNVLRVKFFDWGTVVQTETGCWVVEN
ncbi:hypothetical protein [Pseudothermotoga lettingae]|uniref:hypothetical protein n=1 Tax=Pseudothermotoga lettingae TaxID=177758 RepID=UPI0023A85952|nr:hypothetical protein [Pseudothermotoga lettingae]